jgi:hypothetical protein
MVDLGQKKVDLFHLFLWTKPKVYQWFKLFSSGLCIVTIKSLINFPIDLPNC